VISLQDVTYKGVGEYSHLYLVQLLLLLNLEGLELHQGLV
jgi:hypothetical protein